MKKEVFNDDENMEDVRVKVTRYELFNQTFRYFNIFLRDCLLPAPTHHHLTSESIDPPRKKTKSLSTQDRPIYTPFPRPNSQHRISLEHILQKFQPFYATLPHSPTNPRWSNWVETEKCFLLTFYAALPPAPSLSNLIKDNQIRNSNWAIIRSSIMWQLFAIW